MCEVRGTAAEWLLQTCAGCELREWQTLAASAAAAGQELHQQLQMVDGDPAAERLVWDARASFGGGWYVKRDSCFHATGWIVAGRVCSGS